MGVSDGNVEKKNTIWTHKSFSFNAHENDVFVCVFLFGSLLFYSTASLAYMKIKWNDQKENLSMAKSVGELMQEAQEGLLSKAIDLSCNAVLGMTVNITTDSSGSEGNSKLVIVTVCGTPCCIAPSTSSDIPNVDAELIVEPLYFNNVV